MLRFRLRRILRIPHGILMRLGMVTVTVAFREGTCLKHMHLGAGDSAAVYGFDFQACVEIECSRCIVQNLRRNAGVKQRSEKHVAGDAGKAIKISNTHGNHSFVKIYQPLSNV